MGRVLEIRGGDDDAIHVLGCQQIVHVLKGDGRPAVFVCGGLCRSLAIYIPQIADGDHFDVVTRFESSDNRRKFTAAIADTDVTEVDTIIRPEDSGVGYRRCPQGRGPCQEQCPAAQIFVGSGRSGQFFADQK
jgi:hypothetical protein